MGSVCRATTLVQKAEGSLEASTTVLKVLDELKEAGAVSKCVILCSYLVAHKDMFMINFPPFQWIDKACNN